MNKENTILITGAAGFIGSYLLGYLNNKGFENIIIADDFEEEDKWFNFDSKKFSTKIHRDDLFEWLEKQDTAIDPIAIGFVFHLGARTDTTEFDYSVHERLNLEYSKKIWTYCVRKNIPLVYASSAATYGAGELGYKDDHAIVNSLQPLNPYGTSKNEFDKWALKHGMAPSVWAGLKFFNVYGPNEYHKGRMASMVFHGFNQVQRTGNVKLFKSHRTDFSNGEQLRDFIYVEDVAAVCYWIMENGIRSGIYNLGTGHARSFNDLIYAVFKSLGKESSIEYIDMPEDIREKYQYFTEADMNKLRSAGYAGVFSSLEEGINDYIINYLLKKEYF